MRQRTITMRRLLRAGILAGCGFMITALSGWAQTPPQPTAQTIEQPDAERTKQDLSGLLDRYPPALRGVLALDPGLLSNPAYLAPYPALASYLHEHPEVARDPIFYIGDGSNSHFGRDPVIEMWERVWNDLSIFLGFSLAIGLLVWLIRTLVDYRRWSRLSKVQTEVHTKLLDRFTANEELLAYIQSPAGSRFLQSSPITLDAAPRSVGAPLGRILWSVQGGIVLVACGVGLLFVSGQVTALAAPTLHGLGVLGIALGLGFVISAIISFVISQRLGLIDSAPAGPRAEITGV